MLSAGIGITPVLSMLSALSKTKRQVYWVPGFELLYLTESDHNFERAAKVFATLYPETHILDVTSMTPSGVDHFLEYLHAHENNETRKRPITGR